LVFVGFDLVQTSVLSYIQKTEKLLLAIKKKDFSLFPKTEIKTQNKRIILSVEDNVVGIQKEIQDKIFLPFFTTRSNGSGIGLTLSKSIIEAHKGYLNYKPLEQGSRFKIWFVE